MRVLTKLPVLRSSGVVSFWGGQNQRLVNAAVLPFKTCLEHVRIQLCEFAENRLLECSWVFPHKPSHPSMEGGTVPGNV